MKHSWLLNDNLTIVSPPGPRFCATTSTLRMAPAKTPLYYKAKRAGATLPSQHAVKSAENNL